jgi:hypothetical protein
MGKRLLFLVGIALYALFSCTYEEIITDHVRPDPPAQKTEVKFASSVIVPTRSGSRLLGDLWEPGDAIGMFMIEKDRYAVVEGNSNVRYYTKKSCYTCNFTATHDFIYFPENGNDVRFMSYHPYNESVKGTTYKIDVTNQSPQSALNFLYSFNPRESYDKNIEAGKVPMEFNHEMTKILINIKNGHSLQGYDLMYMKVYFTGLSTHADFNLMTGKMSNLRKASPIYPSILIAGNGNVFSAEAILIPETNLPSDAALVFEMNNGNKDVYKWNLGRSLEKGKKYTFGVTINKTGISVNTTIYNWHNVGIDQEVGIN